MRADKERPLRHRPLDRLHRSLLHVLVGQGRLALAPDLDALDQRTALVVARLANGKHRIQVHMAIYEWRRDQTPSRVYLACSRIHNAWRELCKYTAPDVNVGHGVTHVEGREA